MEVFRQSPGAFAANAAHKPTHFPMTNTILSRASLTTEEAWCEALWQCLCHGTREDGSRYVTLSDGDHWSEIRDDLMELCREAHNGELPNDWRWETIYSIVDDLNSDGWDDDTAAELADRYVDVYTGDLLTWVAGNINRCHWESWDDEGIVEPTTDLVQLLRIRQCEEIDLMVRSVIESLEALAA